MNLCVVGVGGVGGYFGGRLAHAFNTKPDEKVQVSFVARGKHLEMIKQKGLVLKTSDAGRLTCSPHVATDDVEQLPQVDVFIVAVKGFDLEGVARSLGPKTKSDTVILPLLNGVDARERIRAHVKKGRILPACVYVSAYIEEPGVVVQSGTPGRIILGPDPETGHAPVELMAVFQRASIPCELSRDVDSAIWEKYIFIASYGLVTSRFGRTLGEVYEEHPLRGLVQKIMEEIYQITVAKKISLPKDIIPVSLKKANLFPKDAQTSLQRDIQQGKKNELDLFGRTIIEQGRRFDVPTPVTEKVYQEIISRISK